MTLRIGGRKLINRRCHSIETGEDRTCSSEDTVVDTETHRHRHVHHNTLLPYRQRNDNRRASIVRDMTPRKTIAAAALYMSSGSSAPPPLQRSCFLFPISRQDATDAASRDHHANDVIGDVIARRRSTRLSENRRLNASRNFRRRAKRCRNDVRRFRRNSCDS